VVSSSLEALTRLHRIADAFRTMRSTRDGLWASGHPKHFLLADYARPYATRAARTATIDCSSAPSR
jgi:hypothetical protein